MIPPDHPRLFRVATTFEYLLITFTNDGCIVTTSSHQCQLGSSLHNYAYCIPLIPNYMRFLPSAYPTFVGERHRGDQRVILGNHIAVNPCPPLSHGKLSTSRPQRYSVT